jgi:4'-phosphopantetheinyl transferase
MSSCDAACDAWRGNWSCQGWSLLEGSPCDWALLDENETARAHRFKRPELTRRYVAAHAGMRRLLGQQLGVSAIGLQIHADVLGKPRLHGSQRLHFSLSHCGEQALLAYSTEHEVGVDLEAIMSTESITPDLLAWALAPHEIAQLLALPRHAQGAYFTARWVAKEAIVKCLGSGLSLPLSGLPLPLESQTEFGVLTLPVGPPICWQAVQAPAGHVAAIAWPCSGGNRHSGFRFNSRNAANNHDRMPTTSV